MKDTDFFQSLLKNFSLSPTAGQDKLFFAVSKFVLSRKPRCALLIKGYAGTGKTSCVSAIVKSLKLINQRSVLLAPTGRAAKVLGKYSNRSAYTIHKKIYRKKSTQNASLSFHIAPNLHKNTVFIVDEASMIGTDSGLSTSSTFGTRDLLDDLFEFVFSGENCRIILIGDSAQLPPVGSDQSPALQLPYLRDSFDLTIAQLELTEVVRQDQDSGILMNATTIRNQIRLQPESFPQINADSYEDITPIIGTELQETIEDAYHNPGREDTVIITRSNKRANQFNQHIRQEILGHDEELSAGDYLMVVRNNYFWLEDDKNKYTDFIANGDIIEVKSVLKYFDRYGFRFADVEIQMLDYPEIEPFEVRMILDTLYDDTPNLGPEKSKALYHYVAEDYLELKSKSRIHKAIMEDPNFNALQVKFAYAITCHKSQGGQWPLVILDQGYLTEEMMGVEYLRWLYTAFTRASEKLYLVNFRKEFFEDFD